MFASDIAIIETHYYRYTDAQKQVHKRDYIKPRWFSVIICNCFVPTYSSIFQVNSKSTIAHYFKLMDKFS